MESPLKEPNLKIRRAGGFLCLILAFAARGLGSGDGKIWGRVVDAGGAAVAAPIVTLIVHGRPDREIETTGDDRGAFQFLALSPGLYSVRAETPGAGATLIPGLKVSVSSDIGLVLSLAGPGAAGASANRSFDASALGAQTTVLETELAQLPTGNSVGSILENLDFSATTNRIDVGGLWQTRPVLFGSRGGASWLQNVYLLNGMDISDPFQSGAPLWQPDVFSLSSIGDSTAALPAWAFSPGGQITLTPKGGTDRFHGGVSGFYSDKKWASDNLTPALRAEHLTGSDTLNRLMDSNVHLSGPLGAGGTSFFTSWSVQSVGRNLAGFEPVDLSSVVSGLFELEIPYARDALKILWAGQSVADDSFGADKNVDWTATTRRRTLASVFQLIYETKPGQRHTRRFGLSWAFASNSDDPQAGAAGPARLDLFNGSAGAAPALLESAAKHKLVLAFDGSSFFPGLGPTDHRLDYGIQARLSTAAFTRRIPGDLNLLFNGPRPAEIAAYGGPFAYSASALEANAYVQETLTLPNFLSLRLGLNAAWTYGWNGSATVRWLDLSPRAELTIPLSGRSTSAFKISAARYGLQLPLNYLLWGNPKAPGALIYGWTDANGNGTFEESERGPLLRRDGPAFSAVDPSLKRPRMDELVLSYIQDLGAGWRLTLSGFLRETRDLIALTNTGVTAADYSFQTLADSGDNRIPGDRDDLTFDIADRKPEALGRDFFLLANSDPALRTSNYKGLDLTLVKTWSDRFFFYMALTAMEIVGTTNPGNTALENDDGVIGNLYTDPNNSINARGRMRFDRGYTARIGLSAALPLDSRLSFVAKYYDGQPFARKIIVEGLNQGLLYIQAHARGVARYEFNMTVDARLEKSVRIGSTVLRVMADVFNLFNQSQATEENEWTGPDFPLRFATRIQSPRVVRAGFNFEF